MRKSILVLTACLIAMPLMAQEKSEDRSIKERIKDAATTARVETTLLLNDSLNPFDINTTTKRGVVTLDGTVESEVERDLAIELAESAKGVASVVDALEIQPPESADAGAKSSDDPAKGRVRAATTRADVRARLASYDPEVAEGIDVQVHADKVTLSGEVASAKEQRRLITIVEDTRGVEEVFDNLKVAKATGKQATGEQNSNLFKDEWLEKRVETSIMLDKNASMRALDVEVDNRVCTLTGQVISHEQRDLAGKLASEIKGIREVVNNIEVSKPSDD